MKFKLCFLLLTILFVGCKNQGSLNSESAINKVDSSIQQKGHLQVEPIFYADIDNEKQHNFEIINIENEQYKLEINKYCLNDSAIRQNISIDGESEGKLMPAIQVYHNYEVMLHLGKFKSDPNTIFMKKISKEIFKDSLSEEFYNQATVFYVNYHSTLSNRVYCKVVLSMPDSDWQEEFICAIFFRTDKISQMDFWKISSE